MRELSEGRLRKKENGKRRREVMEEEEKGDEGIE